MSQFSFAQSWQGITGVTDSALTHVNEKGESIEHLTGKTWTLPLANMWIVGAGTFRIPPPPRWPWPFPDDRPRSFDQVVEAVKDQIRGLSDRETPYELLLVGGDPARCPQMAKISSRYGLERGKPHAIFTGGLANQVRPSVPDRAPSSLTRCQDLVIAIGSRTFREHPNDRSISWPLRLMTWAWLPWSNGETRTHFSEQVLQEAEGMAVERQAFAAAYADARGPQLAAWIIADVTHQLEANGLYPESVAVSIKPPTVTVSPRTTTSKEIH